MLKIVLLVLECLRAGILIAMFKDLEANYLLSNNGFKNFIIILLNVFIINSCTLKRMHLKSV